MHLLQSLRIHPNKLNGFINMKEGTFISGGQEWVLSVKKGQYHIGYYGDDSTFEFMCPTETMRDYFQKLSTFILQAAKMNLLKLLQRSLP